MQHKYFVKLRCRNKGGESRLEIFFNWLREKEKGVRTVRAIFPYGYNCLLNSSYVQAFPLKLPTLEQEIGYTSLKNHFQPLQKKSLPTRRKRITCSWSRQCWTRRWRKIVSSTSCSCSSSSRRRIILNPTQGSICDTGEWATLKVCWES